ncbi:MAG: hypothetical protein SFV21_08350 [Rhodospirillaceae bacterium]|nr:hypothetical protein [Rhodospirillaceae bacterium]
MTEDEVRDNFAKHLGYFTWVWADLLESVGEIFCVLKKGALNNHSFEEWQALESDGRKLQELRKIAQTKLPLSSDASQAIRWLVGEISSLRDTRNQLVHASFAILHHADGRSSIIPSDWHRNRRSIELAEEFSDGGLVEKLIECRRYLDSLMLFCGDLYQHLVDPEARPVPQRPSK